VHRAGHHTPRPIAGYGVYDHATSANAVLALKGAIAECGKPASVITDLGAQSCAVEAESRRRGTTEFENFLAANDIHHVLARVRHPQTNGKIERLFGVLSQKDHLFVDIDEFMAWRNTASPHMTLNVDDLETPCEALGRKMAPAGATTVTDEKTGEEYAVSWQASSGGPRGEVLRLRRPRGGPGHGFGTVQSRHGFATHKRGGPAGRPMRAQRGVALAAIAAMAAFAPPAAFSQISMGGDAGMPASPPAAPPGQLVADEDTEASAAPLGRTAAGGPHGNGSPGASGQPGAGDHGETAAETARLYAMGLEEGEDSAGNAGPEMEQGDRAYRWGTVGHYALLGAEMYLSDDRHRWAWAREPVEWYPGRPGLGEVQGAEALAEGLVALHRAAAGDVVLRLLLPPETRDALGSSDVRGIAFGIAALREAVHVPTSHRDLLYFALPPETRDALGEKTYGHKALPYGCHLPRPCPDDTPYQFLGSDREAYLRSFHGRTVDFSTAHGLHAICKESNARLVEGVAWMEGDASWLGFMRDCAHWHSGALSEAILEYMEASMSTECRGLIDAGWRVSDAGEFYLPGGSGQAQERPAGNNVDGGGTLWKPPFASRCLPEAYPYGLSIPDRF